MEVCPLGLARMASASSLISPPPIVSSRFRTPATPAHQAASSLFVRRQILNGLALSCPLVLVNEFLPQRGEAREVDVGSFLTNSQSDPSFLVFKASSKDTLALRAAILQMTSTIIGALFVTKYLEQGLQCGSRNISH